MVFIRPDFILTLTGELKQVSRIFTHVHEFSRVCVGQNIEQTKASYTRPFGPNIPESTNTSYILLNVSRYSNS